MQIDSSSFRIRGFFTLLLLLSASIAAVSGIALYLRPEGSLARWVGWAWLGLDKQHWEAVHAIFVLLSLTVGLIHLWYNWKPLASYLKSKVTLILPSGRRLPLIRELLAALAIIAVFWCAAVIPWQPLALLIDLRAQIKDGQYAVTAPPPAADADQLSISELCQITGIAEQSALDRARAHGVIIGDVSLTLREVARQHSLSPEEVYRLLK